METKDEDVEEEVKEEAYITHALGVVSRLFLAFKLQGKTDLTGPNLNAEMFSLVLPFLFLKCIFEHS